MEFLRGLLSSLIMLVAIPLLLVATLSFVARQTIFSEEFVKDQAEENRLYDGLADFAAASLKEQTDDPRLDPVIEDAVTTQRVREAVEPALTKLYSFLAGKTDEATISIDLSAIKGDIKQALPRSGQDELDRFIPNQLTFGEPGSEPAIRDERSGLERFRDWYDRVNRWSALLPFIALGLLVLLFLINKGGGRLRRPAYVLLVVGLSLGIIGGIAAVLIPVGLGRLEQIPNLPALAKESIDNLARSVGGGISRLIFFAGLGYLGLAVLLFVVSIFFREPVRLALSTVGKVEDTKKGLGRR